MADATINGLSSGSTPLAGTEEIPIWQSSATVKVTTQDIADLASGSNIGNADLTIDTSGARKLILGGALSTDYFTIRNSGDTTDILKVQGDDIVRMNKLGIGGTPSASYPVNFSTTSAIAPLYCLNTAASGNALSIQATGVSGRGITLTASGTNAPDGIEINMSSNASVKTGIDLNMSGTATNNVGLDLNVSGGTNNYAIQLTAGDVYFNATTGNKLGTSTSQKIGFWNTTPITQPTAMTAQLTTVSYTVPGTPDYVLNEASGGWGFGSQDEIRTFVSVINNLQTRVQELEDALSTAAGGVGLIA